MLCDSVSFENLLLLGHTTAESVKPPSRSATVTVSCCKQSRAFNVINNLQWFDSADNTFDATRQPENDEVQSVELSLPLQ